MNLQEGDKSPYLKEHMKKDTGIMSKLIDSEKVKTDFGLVYGKRVPQNR